MSFGQISGAGADPLTGQTNGIMHFVIGTGGYNHFDCPTAVRAAYVNDDVFGALFVRIGATSWSWSYLDTDGNVLDDGTKSLIGV